MPVGRISGGLVSYYFNKKTDFGLKKHKKKLTGIIICILAAAAAMFLSEKRHLINAVSSEPEYDYERYFEYIVSEAYSGEDGDGSDAEDSQEYHEDISTSVSLYAGAAVVLDYRDGHILYGNNEFTAMPMASTTKILTAIIALENTSPDEVVTISANAANSPKVRLGVREGEEYYMKDLLLSMMLGSHNDSAVAIAEHIAGSTEAFSKMMNEKAYEIGVSDSSFVTPNGLDDENHYSTAYDMAIIGSYAISNEDFVELVNTSSHSFSEINGKSYHSVNNINSYLTMDDTAIGIKTGFTGKAGYCFVGANTYEGTVVVSCVLACGWPPNKTYKWHDMKALMALVRENYTEETISAEQRTLSVPVDAGETAEILLLPQEIKFLRAEGESVVQIVKVIPEGPEEKIAQGESFVVGGYAAEEYFYYGNVVKKIENGMQVKS